MDAGIRVRGLGSTKASASNALVVIDGVPAPMVDDLNPLAALNSSDIESIIADSETQNQSPKQVMPYEKN